MAQMLQPLNLSKLARELAMDVLDLDEVLGSHGLTLEDFEQVAKDPRFGSMLENMTSEWNAADNTRERVKVKSALAVEAAIETMFQDVIDRGIPLGQRVSLLTAMAKLGDLEIKSDEPQVKPGDRLSISINIGANAPEQRMITIDTTAKELEPSE